MMHGLDHSTEDLAGWVASEKFDGCRAYWTGFQLLTKSGRIYPGVPPAVLAALQSYGRALDCELTAGRGMGPAIPSQAAIRGNWASCLQLIVFDLPGDGDAAGRLARLSGLPARGPVSIAPSWRVSSTGDAIERMRQVQREGGEGLMLRRPGGFYQPGRSADLLKLK